MDLSSYVNDIYFPSRLIRNAKSREQIVVAVRQMDKQTGRATSTFDLSEELIASHLSWLLLKPLSVATVNSRRGYFMTLWRHAYRKKKCLNDPGQADIPVMQGPKKKPRAWSIDDMHKMMDQAAIAKARQWFGPAGWMCLIQLLYFTGLRINAALSLKRSDLHGHILIVPPEIQKDKEELVVRLPNDLANRLVSLPRPQIQKFGRNIGEMLIPWPWSFDHLQDKFRDYILLPAGLPNDPKLKFHAIRRTVATVVAATNGKEAAREVMGHSSVSVTEKYIADIMLVAPALASRVQPMDVMPRLDAI